MGTTARGSRGFVVLAAGLFLSGIAFPLQAESIAAEKKDEAPLRKKALELNDLTGAEPMEGRLKELEADVSNTKKLLAVALRMSKEKPQPFNRNATLLMAVAADRVKDVDTSAAFYRLNASQALKLYSERGLAQAYVGLIQLYVDAKRFAESEKVCKEFLAIDGEEDDAIERLKPMVMRRMILAVAKQGAMDRALKMIDDQVQADPRNWLHRALKAQVLREADKPDEAIKVYLDVIDRIKRDGRIEKEDQNDYIDTYRYSLSGIYIEIGDVQKAAEQLEILLERHPNDPTYNNDLGFIWADKGTNLPRAEKLIRKAIEEDAKIRKKHDLGGENAAYLDSLGWVLYKQGKAKEGLTHLLQAVKSEDGQNVEIYDHLAEIHLALGDKAAAVSAWKKGIQIAGTSKRDQKRKVEVLKKLEMHQSK